MNPLNYNEKYEDLQKLEEYKVLTTYQKLMLIELKIIAESLHDISKSLKVDIINTSVSKNAITYRLADILYNPLD